MLVKKNLHVRKDDQVQLMCGDEKGKRGRVLHVFPEKGLVIVEGVNFIWKHLRKTQQNPQGGRLQKEAAVRACNVALVDAQKGIPTRVKYVERKEKRGEKTVAFRYRMGKKSKLPVSAKDKEYAEKKA